MPEVKKRPEYFCHRCGARLVSKEVYHEFDVKTGKKFGFLKWSCPNRRWFQPHTKFTSYDLYEIGLENGHRSTPLNQ